MSFSVRDVGAVPAWQQRALQRSLSEVRARSVERLGQFVDSARQLATEHGSADFTVQQVVRRSGLSLKAFYRYFEGKDDLLLALIEEDSRIGALLLGEYVDDHDRPGERLEAYVRGLSQFGSVGDRGYVSVLLREHRRLAAADADRMRAALAPFVDLLVRLLEEARQVGLVRDRDPRRDATTVFNLVLDSIATVVLTAGPVEADEVADYVWDFCWAGLGGGGDA